MHDVEPAANSAVLTIAFAAGAVLLAIAALYASRAFSIRNPAPTIAHAPDGDVSLIGVAAAFGNAPHLTPYRGEPCVWFEATVEESITERDNDNRESQRMALVRRSYSTMPFLLRDPTGVVRVEAWQARLMALPQRKWYDITLHPERQDGHRPAVAGVRGTGYYCYTEQWIPLGTRVFVQGGLGRGPGMRAPAVPRSTEDEEARTRLDAEVPRRVGKPDSGEFIVAGDGPDAVRRRFLLLAAAWAAGAIVAPFVLIHVLDRM